MTTVLFSGKGNQAEAWGEALTRWSRDLGVPIKLYTDPATVSPTDVDVVVVNPNGVVSDFAPYSNAKMLQSIWAGVEVFLANKTIPDGPILTRMVEDGMTEAMSEYICGHVMRHHLGLDQHIHDSARAVWNPVPPPIARERRVGVMGLGALGSDAAKMLVKLNFDVAGWSQSQKDIEGVKCLCGAGGLRQLIERSEILITILPLTDATRHVLNAESLFWAPKGAVIINPGRGPLINDDALLAALAVGHIGHATLDVFDIEPLPTDHPYWRNPNVTVTPHLAAETRTNGAARFAVEQIGRLQRGEPLLHVVDRGAGY
ncbi:MAG: 2-hydroxyacid dehydrogenase [Pikeienuella sp.]